MRTRPRVASAAASVLLLPLLLPLGACGGSGKSNANPDGGSGGSGGGGGGGDGTGGNSSGGTGGSGSGGTGRGTGGNSGGGTGGNGSGGTSRGTGGSSGGATGGAPGGTAGGNRPVILSFSAAPATLPQGGGQTTLRWQVTGADSLSIDRGVGAVTGDSATATVTATTIYTLTATNTQGSTTSAAAVVVGSNPRSRGNRFVSMIAPTSGETFTAPASLRLMASGRDPNVDTNQPRDGLGGNASKVTFFVDDQQVLEVAGDAAEYWVFKGFTSGVAAGVHRVWARAVYTNPADVLDSEPALVTVEEPPAYARTVTLDADVMLSGSTGYELIGAADGRIKLVGNGFRIVSSGNATGKLTLRYVDVFDVGSRTSGGTTGIDVSTSGAVAIENCNFDSSNTVRVVVGGSATASVRNNTFRSNMRMTLGQNPEAGTGGSYPAVRFGGSSTGAKVFQGNNVGAGWASFEAVSRWLVGGDTDADGNVLIGPRVGIYVRDSRDVQVRRNYSHHVYFGGWSQGSNFELGHGPTNVVEHNVVFGSSWPVRGVGCEFRYNLVLDAGHQWLWADESNASVHHNVFVGGDADIGGIYVLYTPMNVRIFNNTVDGQNNADMVTAVKISNGVVALTSNLFYRVTRAPTVSLEGGTLTADYNLFGNAMQSSPRNYSDGRHPDHDVGALNVQTDPRLAEPGPPPPMFDFDEDGLWKRDTSVRQVLARYRERYTPAAGSATIDAGDPALGAGNDIGAVGAGEPHPADRFGLP